MSSEANQGYMTRQGLNYEQRTVTATCTLRTGRATDIFMADSVVIVEDPAADVTLTVPDGVQVGQTMIIVFESNDDSKTLTVTTTTGTDYSSTTAGQYTYIIWSGATSGWLKVSGTFS